MTDKTEVKGALDNYYSQRVVEGNPDKVTKNTVVLENTTSQVSTNYDKQFSSDQDSDLSIGFDNVKLPSGGKFYRNKQSEIVVEYLTSKDEDILTTPALIENNTLFDVLLKNKIKSKGVDVDELLTGDKNAILMFLRASSYGKDYDVTVVDPFTNREFKSKVDLTRFVYKNVTLEPDENLLFNCELPFRKKLVKFRLLSDSELKKVIKLAENRREASGTAYIEILSMRLKSSIVSVDGNKDRNYINKFVDAMPAGDSLALRRKIEEATPMVDMSYEFTSPAGYTFKTEVSIGYDFFFPKN